MDERVTIFHRSPTIENGTKIVDYTQDKMHNVSVRKEYSTNSEGSTNSYYYFNNSNNSDQNYFVFNQNFVNSSSAPTQSYNYNTHDSMGNMITSDVFGAAYNFTYDADNMLKTSAAGLVTYKYDSNGLLYRRLGVANDGEVIFENTEYIYDENGQLVVEIDNIRNTKTKYVRSIDGEISKTIDKNNNLINYYIYNLRGDVYRLANADGQVTAEYKYDAYGNVISSTGNSAGSNYMRYCGEYYDKYTQCIYLRARMYNPKLMQFMQQDSYLGDVGSVASRNLYTYCSNDPINNCDPTGHWSGKIHREITSKALAEGYADYFFSGKTPAEFVCKFLKNRSLFNGKFIKNIMKGCTYPDKFRYRDEDKNGKPDKKSKLFGGMVFHDSNDTTKKGYWHGGEEYELEGKKLTKKIKKAAKFFNNEKYKKAGIYLGCIFHAVQDIAAHRYNEDIKILWGVPNKKKSDDEKIRDIINFSKDIENTSRNHFKERYVYKLEGKKKKGSKKTHALFADNEYASYNKATEKWYYVNDYLKNPRIINSISRSKKVFKSFIKKVKRGA